MTESIWAVVPFKDAPFAKSRFHEHLEVTQRGLLAQAMLRDILSALNYSSRITGTVVCSSSAYVKELNYENTVLFEDHSSNLRTALTRACEFTKKQFNNPTICIVPADIPLVQSHDINELLKQHHEVTVVPDAQQLGTNALVISPPIVFELVFDGQSFGPHLKNIRAVGIEPKIVQMSSFAIDIHHFEDLFDVIEKATCSQTASVIFNERLLETATTQ